MNEGENQTRHDFEEHKLFAQLGQGPGLGVDDTKSPKRTPLHGHREPRVGDPVTKGLAEKRSSREASSTTNASCGLCRAWAQNEKSRFVELVASPMLDAKIWSSLATMLTNEMGVSKIVWAPVVIWSKKASALPLHKPSFSMKGSRWSST